MNATVPIPQGLPVERDTGPFDPPSLFPKLRAARPVSPLRFPDGHDGWLITGYDEARKALVDKRFSSRGDLGVLHLPYVVAGMPEATEPMPPEPGLFISMDPPDHTRLRSMLTGAFTVRRMKQLEEHVVDLARRQAAELARQEQPADLVRHFALPVPSLVICELLGVPYADRDTFQHDAAATLDNGVSYDEQIAAYLRINAYLTELVTRKRAEPADDLLSDLARRTDIEIPELAGVAFLLLVAGHETTANVLGLGTFALLEHPEQLAALRADPELLPTAVEELLRYLSVADIFYRYAACDIDFAGQTIPEGSTVLISLLSANRDPARFEAADELDVHRNARGHLAFGHGIHQCLGQQLARIELRAGFEALLSRFDDLRLAVAADEVRLRTTKTIFGVEELPVTWTAR